MNKSGAYAIYRYAEEAISNYNITVIFLIKKCYNNILPKIKNHDTSPIVPIVVAHILRFTKPQTAIKPRIIATIKNMNGGVKPWAFSFMVVFHLRSLFENFGKNSLFHHLHTSLGMRLSASLFFRIFSQKSSYIFRCSYYKYFSKLRRNFFNGFFPKILINFDWSFSSPFLRFQNELNECWEVLT